MNLGPTPLSGDELEARLDPAHAEMLRILPADLFNVEDLAATREMLNLLTASASVGDRPDIVVEDHQVPARDGTEIVVRSYRPASPKSADQMPALVWVHGGGYIMGSVLMNDPLCADWAVTLDIAVFSVEYRLAPEHPYPVPLNDCEDAANWVFEQASKLGLDERRIAVGGSSAGGGLAAALVHRLCKGAAGHRPVFQLLVYPMLDDRMITPSSKRIVDSRVWNVTTNTAGWNAYLRGTLSVDDRTTAHDAPPAEAAPARFTVDDLAGLPPAFIPVGDMDLFVDEDVAYAAALRDAGVAAEVHVMPGAFHASNLLVPGNDLSERWADAETHALRRGLGLL